MSEDRLVHLKSYAALPPKLQSAVKLALLYRVPGPKAVALLDLPNPTRTWESERVQAVVAAYGNPELETDYVARLAAIRGEEDKPAPVIEPEKPMREHEPPKPAAPAPQPPEGARCPGCGFVICGCHRPAATSPPKPVTRPGDPPGMKVEPVAADRPAPDPTSPAGCFDVSDLFPGLNRKLEGGLSSAQIWQQQDAAEADERDRLTREFQRRQELNHVL